MPSKRNPWEFFLHNIRLTYLIVGAIVLFGAVSILRMPKESSPEIDIPVIVVTTTLPGASAIDVEELVTDEIESRVQGLEDVDTIQSSSVQGLSLITVTFDVDSNGREKLTDVRNRVERAKGDLPSDASDPVVQQVSFSDRPILNLSMSGPYPLVQLKGFAEQLQKEVERVGDVSEVKITGAPDEEIHVVVDQARAEQFGLSISQIVSRIGAANIDVPIGSVVTENELFTVRFEGRLKDIDDVRYIPVGTRANTVVFLEDVADVSYGFEEQNTINRLSVDGEYAEQSISLQVFKVSGSGNILSIVDQVGEVIDSLSLELPEDINITYVENDAELIRTDLSNLVSSGVFTMVIILVLLTLFLGIKEALIASAAVPMTFLMSFIVLGQLGYTINFLTLFSLILALGILVDGSIVVIEGIFTNVQNGMSGKDAARATILEFQKPLIAGTLTTIFVFLPLLLTSGIIGKFIRSIPVTVSIVLISSIIVALGFITAFSSRIFKQGAVHARGGMVEDGIARVYAWYSARLAVLLNSRRYIKRFLVGIVILFFVSLSLPVIGVVSINMFPADDADTIYIDLKNPVGTPLEQTDLMVRVIEDDLYADPRIESFSTTVGGAANLGNDVVSNQRSHLASIVVNVTEDRSQTSSELIAEYETRLQALVSGEIRVAQLDSGPPQGSAVQVNIVGDSFLESEDTARLVASLLEDIEGTRNISNGIEETNGEFVISIDRARAELYGVSVGQVAGAVRNAIVGTEATVVKNDGTDLDVVVRSSLPQQQVSGFGADAVDIESIQSVVIATPRGTVPLSTFANIVYTSSRATILHEDGDRILHVTSGVVDGYTATAIVSALQDELTTVSIPDSVVITYGGESEDINQSFADLGVAMILGIVMIFGLLVWQFQSYRQSLFILVTIPLALIGVFGGLALTGQPLSFPGFIGVVALAGIVVNNAIILIDSINNNRESGMTVYDAVTASARSRLQPILLTTITTVAGMIPLAFSSPTWAPLAYSIMFGLLFSTVLTLFVVPSLYVTFVRES